jgi:hypothetical protein
MAELQDQGQAGALSQLERKLREQRAALVEAVGDWMTSNSSELRDGGSGDVIDLALRIEPFFRSR